MKKGSGDDPFADVEEERSDEEDGEAGPPTSGADPQGSDAEDAGSPDSSPDASSSTVERYTDSPEESADATTRQTADTSVESRESSGSAGTERDDSGEKPEPTGGSDAGTQQSKAEADGIPWVLRRSRVKEDRENVHQFFLREEYSTREDEILDAVAGELDMRQKDLQKLDVREAMVASADPEAIADVLREWGYEYLK